MCVCVCVCTETSRPLESQADGWSVAAAISRNRELRIVALNSRDLFQNLTTCATHTFTALRS
jgi:hypothetical protein